MQFSVLIRLFDLASLEDYFYRVLISSSRLFFFRFCFPKTTRFTVFAQRDCDLMLGIVCVMICNLSSANFKVAIRRGLFGRLSVLIRRIRILEALDWDPRCFPVLDGLYLASSVVSFSATASCEFGFNLSKSSRTICFSSLRLMWFVPNYTFIIQPSE